MMCDVLCMARAERDFEATNEGRQLAEISDKSTLGVLRTLPVSSRAISYCGDADPEDGT